MSTAITGLADQVATKTGKAAKAAQYIAKGCAILLAVMNPAACDAALTQTPSAHHAAQGEHLARRRRHAAVAVGASRGRPL